MNEISREPLKLTENQKLEIVQYVLDEAGTPLFLTIFFNL